MTELWGIGKAWAGAFRKEIEPDSRIVADTPISSTTLKANPSTARTAASAAASREKIDAASAALRAALGGFSRETKEIYSTTVSARATSGTFSGRSPQRDPIALNYAVLETTSAINTRSSTVRSSTTAIGLDVTSAELSSTRGSTAEMNIGTTTSYGSSLTFTGSGAPSASSGTLAGTFAGTGAAANATALTFEVTQGDNISTGFLGLGSADIAFRVKDQNGTVLFTYSGAPRPNEGISLGADIGLTVSFSAGQLRTGHTATTAITRTPITVSTTAAFNASAAQRPNFDCGDVVTAGSFKATGRRSPCSRTTASARCCRGSTARPPASRRP